MARSKRRKSGWLPFVVPVHSGWQPRVGDKVLTFSPAGDPRDSSTSLEQAYIVPPKTPIGPLLLSNFIDVVPLSDDQFHFLQKTLGAAITEETRDEIDAAIRRLVTTIALSARIPGWDAFRKRLQAIIKSGQDCIKAAQQFVQMTDPSFVVEGNPKGALSLDRAVKQYLSLAGFKNSIVEINIDAILAACQQGLQEVEPRASSRGPKGNNLMLWRFLQSVETAAKESGGPMRLPSDRIREETAPQSTTPLFDFGRECLKIAISNGKVAIGAASLADDEKVQAERMLSYLNKYIKDDHSANGALLSRWRSARAKAKTDS